MDSRQWPVKYWRHGLHALSKHQQFSGPLLAHGGVIGPQHLLQHAPPGLAQ
jgi:hypothetical protein